MTGKLGLGVGEGAAIMPGSFSNQVKQRVFLCIRFVEKCFSGPKIRHYITPGTVWYSKVDENPG